MQHMLVGGNGQSKITIDPSMCNRHGLVAGATGTGKTVTLQVLAEQFSDIGVPVFLTDVKGDLSGLAAAGKPHRKVDERCDYIGISKHVFNKAQVTFWDVFGKKGHPVRTTISDIGPLLLANLLELNDTQTGVIYACFRIADENGWLILDFDDLRSILRFMSDNNADLSDDYGLISKASIGAIQRRLLVLQEQGIESFLGEPALVLDDLMQPGSDGHGVVNILDVSRLIQKSPRLYATVLLWLLSELFENLPEVGDLDKPKLVLFFDEAHLLFHKAPKVLIEKIEQVVRLIRSKSVGVFFITQSPLDIPEAVLGQLGLKIQHALRAFTPKDKKTIKMVADNFRQNPDFRTIDKLPALNIGEALVSVLDENGSPTPVECTLICPPCSKIGAIDAADRKAIIDDSKFKNKYTEKVNRVSAHELLKKRTEKLAAEEAAAEKEAARQAEEEKQQSARNKRSTRRQGSGRKRRTKSSTQMMFDSLARTIGSQLGRKITRGILGAIFKR